MTEHSKLKSTNLILGPPWLFDSDTKTWWLRDSFVDCLFYNVLFGWHTRQSTYLVYGRLILGTAFCSTRTVRSDSQYKAQLGEAQKLKKKERKKENSIKIKRNILSGKAPENNGAFSCSELAGMGRALAGCSDPGLSTDTIHTKTTFASLKGPTSITP